MNCTVITVLQVVDLNNRKKIIDLLQKYKEKLLATEHFDEVKISLSDKNLYFMAITLCPKSTDEWSQYQHTDMPAIRDWFNNHLEIPMLAYIVQEWNAEVPRLKLYKEEVREYREWLAPLTNGLDESSMDSLGTVLSEPDLKKHTQWTSKIEGMSKILGLTKTEEEKISMGVFILN